MPETRAPLVTGVSNPSRLRAVAESHLVGHLRDAGLDAVVASLHVAIHAPIVVVNLVTPGLQTYLAEIGVGDPCSTVPDSLSFCAEVVDSGAPLVVPDATAHPIYANNPLVRAGSVGAYAGVPVVDDGVVLGSLAIFADAPREFTEDELALLYYQARLVSSSLALRRMARVDSLTGLPNRALLSDRLAWAILHLERQPGQVGVLFLDLDSFKEVNDRLGHAAGDEQLVAVAAALRQAVRVTDTVARLGGDEFVVVCEAMTSTEEVLALAERILAAIDTLPSPGHGLRIDASIGIGVSQSSKSDPEELLRRADEAMYRAKQDPRARLNLATPTLEAPIVSTTGSG
jgi:diguanylate cyclase (GGDEF)-like protein